MSREHSFGVTEVWVPSHFGEGQRGLVSCLFAFPAVREHAHNRQLVTQEHNFPRCLCASFPLLAPLNHNPPFSLPPPILECYLSHDYTWDPLASVPFLSSDQLLTPALHPPCLLFSAHVLTLNCLENRKAELRLLWKKKKKGKIDQGPGKLQKKDVSKCFLCNKFYPSHTFLLKATLLGTQKWVFLFGNNSRRASEATVKLLQSRCFFLSPINLTPTPPLSSFMLASAYQF